jgi:hypothetical protein
VYLLLYTDFAIFCKSDTCSLYFFNKYKYTIRDSEMTVPASVVHLAKKYILYVVCIVVICVALLVALVQSTNAKKQIDQSALEKEKVTAELSATKKKLTDLENQDQVKINKQNTEEIKDIHDSYQQAVKAYEALLDVAHTDKNYKKLSAMVALSLGQLSEKNYASANATLTAFNTELEKQKQAAIVAAAPIPQNVPVNNAAPSSGYSRQSVHTDSGDYLVDIVAGDLSSTRVIVDTASDSDCHDNCPVMALGDYVARNGAFAGINGSYFCPASYPTCAGKTNSFDTLLMNKNKHYFNSDNNVYSTVPAVIFLGGSVRFVGQSLQWGRDTGIDSMIANQPLLVSGGHSVFGGDSEAKRSGAGTRSFVANKGNVVYIGVVHDSSAAQMAKVLETKGMENALNLDSGGSVALWSGGYKAGPGRAIPNAILFVRK